MHYVCEYRKTYLRGNVCLYIYEWKTAGIKREGKYFPPKKFVFLKDKSIRAAVCAGWAVFRRRGTLPWGSIHTGTKLHQPEKINKGIKACIIWLRESNCSPQQWLKRLQHSEKLHRGLKETVLKTVLTLQGESIKAFYRHTKKRRQGTSRLCLWTTRVSSVVCCVYSHSIKLSSATCRGGWHTGFTSYIIIML